VFFLITALCPSAPERHTLHGAHIIAGHYSGQTIWLPVIDSSSSKTHLPSQLLTNSLVTAGRIELPKRVGGVPNRASVHMYRPSQVKVDDNEKKSQTFQLWGVLLGVW